MSITFYKGFEIFKTFFTPFKIKQIHFFMVGRSYCTRIVYSFASYIIFIKHRLCISF